jgi:transcription termination factor NusB
VTQNARTSSLKKNKIRRKRAIASFETQIMKVYGETCTNIFVNGLLDKFRLAIMRDQPLSSSHPRNNDKRFDV